MDELFDKIKHGASVAKDTAGKFAKQVAHYTSNAVTSTKLSFSINEANNKMKDIFAKIGKDIYEMHNNGEIDASSFNDEFEQISKLKSDIEALTEKKAELKNSVYCANCNTMNNADSDFCSKCGAALIKKDDYDDSDINVEFIEDEEITITPQESE